MVSYKTICIPVLLVGFVLLGSCGFKGPLYLPKKPVASAPLTNKKTASKPIASTQLSNKLASSAVTARPIESSALNKESSIIK